jgi:CubicO group peptidase (beta-lactamase class C family)
MAVESCKTVRKSLIVAVFLLWPIAAAAQSVPTTGTDDLVGLWKAFRWFGPRARGTLIIQRNGQAYTADISGRVAPIKVVDQGLSFELPNGEGTFRGKLQPDGSIIGTWIPPEALGMRDVYASPVRLSPNGPNRWIGQVTPFEDTYTFYLLLQKRPDGSLGALLRNIDRDNGSQWGVDRLTIDGKNLKLVGKLRGQGEEIVIASGTYDRESGIISLGIPDRGGTFDFRRETDTSDFYPRGRQPALYTYRPPLVRDDGWPTGTLEDVGIDRSGIEKFIQTILEMPMDSIDAPQVHAILIVRHGKLVLEEYFHGFDRDQLHETRSGSKSVTATLVGAAIQAGAQLDVSTRVYKVMNGGSFQAGLEARKQAMTLEHLLTMSSGYYCDDNDDKAPGNENTVAEQTEDPDHWRYTLKLPMAMAPGEKAIYCSINPNLALGVVAKATGEPPLWLFDRLIGGPMKISRYGWGLDPAGNPYGGGGLKLLPRDFTKFGQLMLNGGVWQGKRILSRTFVEKASSPLVKIGDRGYGYLWWYQEFPYRDRTVKGFAALGAGGQTVTVIPELDLVIAGFHGNYFSRGWRWFGSDGISKYILPAVVNK